MLTYIHHYICLPAHINNIYSPSSAVCMSRQCVCLFLATKSRQTKYIYIYVYVRVSAKNIAPLQSDQPAWSADSSMHPYASLIVPAHTHPHMCEIVVNLSPRTLWPCRQLQLRLRCFYITMLFLNCTFTHRRVCCMHVCMWMCEWRGVFLYALKRLVPHAVAGGGMRKILFWFRDLKYGPCTNIVLPALPRLYLHTRVYMCMCVSWRYKYGCI